MVLSSSSISLTTREPAVATWDEGSKSPDREGARAGDEERRQQPEQGVREDQRMQPQEQLTPEKEREPKERAYQEDQERKRRQAEAEEQASRAEEQVHRAEEQMRQAERERETSVKIYQYRRSVPMTKGRM